MTGPTDAQQREMLDLLSRTHAWIDALQTSGIEEKTIVTAVQAALIERLLRAGGVAKAAEWLQSQADMAHRLGPQMLAEIKRQGRC